MAERKKRVTKRDLQRLADVVANNKIDAPSLAEVVSHFIELTGGTKGMAQLLYEHYCDKNTSQMTRHRIFETILRGLKFVNQQDGTETDLGIASDEDIEREAEELIRNATGKKDRKK